MNSREKILSEVLKNQPAAVPIPDLGKFKGREQDNVQEYVDTFTSIGGTALVVDDIASMKALILEKFDTNKRIVTTLSELSDSYELYSPTADPHTFENVELVVIKAHLAVAENGAVWLTDPAMGQRILPFICQHLAVWIDAHTILPTMHEAYRSIGVGDYGFGVFIGGPSKTADIEQSLVLGAHGPISMTVFVKRS